MKYLVFVEWGSTKGNHAGMAYLAKKIKQTYPNDVVLFKIPVYHFHGGKYFANLISVIKLIYLLLILRKSDQVFLMEYLSALHNWAYWIKILHGKCKVVALAHFVNDILDDIYPNSSLLQRHISYVDKLLVLGHSLKDYLTSRGIDAKKIEVTFHYVDVDFYFKRENVNKKTQVLFMGSLKRDFNLLREIIQKSPSTDFHVLMGKNNLKQKFAGLDNAILHHYLSEEELRDLMQQSDISLNVMEDTIGSNVIVTSLACGLAMIVSDVGSIRDYCDEQNAIFCKNTDDFCEAISKLTKNKDILKNMKLHSHEKAQTFSLAKFLVYFKASLFG